MYTKMTIISQRQSGMEKKIKETVSLHALRGQFTISLKKTTKETGRTAKLPIALTECA